MEKDCLLAGVGGQGTVLASKLIAQTALSQGAFVRTSETIGMAQRGGCVVSHVRIGSKDKASAISKHKADLLIGFELAETVRAMPFLKKGGVIVANVSAITPITAALDGGYDCEKMETYLANEAEKVIFVDGSRLCDEVGSSKVLNVIMLGVCAREGILPFGREELIQTITTFLPEKIQAINIKALEAGFNYKNN